MMESLSDSDMRTIAMRVVYKGEPFCGFARQEGLQTVQGEIENALRILFRESVETVCAGRTDSGVHAIGQVVSAQIPSHLLEDRTEESMLRSLNALTHDAIGIKSLRLVPDGFSARFDALWREYRYRLAFGANKPILTDEFTWWIGSIRSIDVDAMRRAAELMVGERDFKSFCVAASAEGKTTMRNVMELEIFEESVFGEPGITFRIVGNAFLHSMVRTIVGTLVEVGSSRRAPEWVSEVLEARERGAAGQTAPAKGLIFWHVEYPESVGEI